MESKRKPVVAGAVENVEISLLLRDFQAEWESPVFGLFRGAPFSTALLPPNSAMEPQIGTFAKRAPSSEKHLEIFFQVGLAATDSYEGLIN